MIFVAIIFVFLGTNFDFFILLLRGIMLKFAYCGKIHIFLYSIIFASLNKQICGHRLKLSLGLKWTISSGHNEVPKAMWFKYVLYVAAISCVLTFPDESLI